MSTTIVVCPACSAKYKVKVEHVGKKAKCAKCSHLFVVPATVEGPGPSESSDSDALLACRYCGFQDAGNFCSNCGGRLASEPTFAFDRCKVPLSYLARLPSTEIFDLDAGTEVGAAHNRRCLERRECEHFNQEIDEMARVIRYKGVTEAVWRFDRLTVARMLDSLPPNVPERDALVSGLWSIVSDVEFLVAQREAQELTVEVRRAIDSADAKAAEKSLRKLGELARDAPSAASAALLTDLESELRRVQSAETAKKQMAAFQKLLEKADKLAFQHEKKRAAKAYQECLFWLSRNELLEKESLQADVDRKIEALGEIGPN